MTRHTLVSIIGMNRAAGTRECIDALMTSGCPVDMVLTDQNSRDGTGAMFEEIKAMAPAATLFHETSNTGFQHPGNRAFEMAIKGGYEFLLLLNDDLIVPRSFLMPLYACFDRDKDVVLAGTSHDVCCQLDGQFRGGPGARVDYIEGSLLLICVAKLKAMFGWRLFAPELQHIYCEDSDLGLRVQEAGGKLATALIKVKHARSSTTHADPEVKELCRQSEERNRAYCLQRWAHWLQHQRHDYPILVRRKAALGDVVLATAAIRAIKQARPLSPIFVETGVPEVLTSNPHIVGAYKHIGNPSPECLIVDLDMAYEDRPQTHVIDAYAEVVRERVPGVGAIEHVTEMFPSADDAGWAGTVRNRFCSGDDKLALIHAGPSHWAGKHVPKERFEEIANRLVAQGWKVATVGAQNIELPGTVNLTGQTSIMRLAALCRFAQLFVSIDSGPMHVAQASGVPTVGIFGCTSARYLMTNGSPHAAAEADASIPCAGERHRQSGVTFTGCAADCIESVTVERVMEAIAKLEL